MLFKYPALLAISFMTTTAAAGSYYSAGKITSLLASGTEPAIRLTGNISPDLCEGGAYGWLLFEGTDEQKSRVYSSALALSISGKDVTVYTNSDNERCRINNIQVTNGLN